jgi:hypothetical protein
MKNVTTKTRTEVTESHLDDALINTIFEQHSYAPRMNDSEAVRMILDLVKTNTTIYGDLIREMGKPSKKDNPEHYAAFYKSLRFRVCAKFGIENGSFTPFVPFELITLYNDVRVGRNRDKASKLIADTAQLYRSQALQFDEWAKAANYIEAIR